MTEEATGKAAVYVSWKTLRGVFDSLVEGIPSRVDKSVFVGQSGGVQSQLMAALKFLGLITDDGTPTLALKAVAVTDEKARKEALQKILKAAYSDIFKSDLMSITSAQLYEQMGSAYSCTGQTREKAIRFFLAALKYAEIPVGRLLLQVNAANGGNSRKGRRAATRTRSGADDADDDDDDDTDDDGHMAPPATGTSKTITLKSGHTLTVSTTAGVFDTGEDDRKFLFDLIDKLNAYERANEQAD